MNKIQEHERIVLTRNLPEYGLREGDIGTVVLVHRNGEGFEVEKHGHARVAMIGFPSVGKSSMLNEGFGFKWAMRT